jgi:hypothetical protein
VERGGFELSLPSSNGWEAISFANPRRPNLRFGNLCRRLPVDCLYDVGRRKTRRHIEGIRNAIDTSSDVDLVAFSIEAQFMICADIDNHPGIARSRRPRLPTVGEY